jgi:hypothetical protein
MNLPQKNIRFALVALALLSCVPKFAQAPAPAATQMTAFVGVNVIPMDRDRVIRNQTVLVEDGKIKAVGAGIDVPAGANVIDGHGMAFLSPGLADMHSHSDTPEDLILYLAKGVTTVLNMGGARNNFIAQVRPKVNRGEIPGPHIYASFRVDGTPQFGQFVVTTPDEARSLVRLVKTNGYDFIKVYNNLSSACFYALIEEGRAQDIPIIGHGVTQVGIERQLAAGQLLVAHTEEFLYTFFAKPESEQTDEPPSLDQIPIAIFLTKRYGSFVTADLNTYATIARQWGDPATADEFLHMPDVRYLVPDWRITWPTQDYKERKGTLAGKLEFLKVFTKAMADAGVHLITGTDAPTIPGVIPGFSLHRDLHVLEQAGLTRYQVLSAATRVPGEFIRKAIPKSESVGTIAPGNRADLILSTGNPLDDLSTIEKPLGVMAHGVWYTASDLQSLLEEVAKKYEMR